MPPLVAFGRTWEFGSDDMFCPGLCAVIVHAIWLFGMLGGVIYYRDALACEPSNYLIGFAAFLLFITLCGIIVELAIVILSTRGSIVRLKPRRPIVPLLYVRVLITVIEVVLLFIGTVFVVTPELIDQSNDCKGLDRTLTMMRVVVGAYWFSFLMMVCVVAMYLDPCHCCSAKVDYREVTRLINQGNINEEVIETQWRLVHTAWEKRFKVLCCLAGSEDVHHLAYREVAEIFAHLFCDTNVVMSDIAAGFLLLQKQEIAQEKAARMGISQTHTDSAEGSNEETLFSFDFHVQEDRELFRDAVHFLKYAVGMYTWPFFIYMNPMCGLCRLYSHLNCCCCYQNTARNIYKDNRCSCHVGGLRQFTGLDEMDIIYASFENDVYKVPFMVCYDHESKSVVLAYRGTLSLGDIVTDLTASTKPIELPDFPNFLVHKGMLKSVMAIHEKLENDRILENAFERVNGYNLIVVGHSLGSGCAGLSAILLREKYPNIRCFCYSPTGALLNEAAAIYSEEFVTSITLGKDFVARMNVPNTHKLKEDLVKAIEACKKSKSRILAEGCLETMATCFGASVVFNEESSNHCSYGTNGVSSTTDVAIHMDTDGEGEVNSVESDPLLTSEPGISPADHRHNSPSIPDPTRSLRLGVPPISNPSMSLKSSDRPFDSKKHSEITPIFHPDLSSLKLPVRGTGRVSPSSSISKEVQRRLVPLFPPGRIIHIVDVSETKTCFCASRQLEVQWASKHKFDRFKISPEMIRDHFPDVLSRAMHAVWNRKVADMEDSEIRHRHVSPSADNT